VAGLAALAPTDNLDHERLARSGKSLLSIASVAQDKIGRLCPLVGERRCGLHRPVIR